MVDLILASTLVAAFYGGFKVGNRHKTMSDAIKAVTTKFSS